MSQHACRTCGASWTRGQWSWACEECGGGALSLPCGLCLGHCGATWTRAIMDSNDYGRSHFVGQCIDPRPEAEKLHGAVEATKALLQIRVPVVELRAALDAFTSDVSWTERPGGPPGLEVLRDELLCKGWDISPRILAGLVFFTSPRRQRR